MSSLLRSIHRMWEANATLCGLVPYERVYTGRIPQTEQYRFPYVSIMATQGSMLHRTDKSRYTRGPLSFHIWVDDARLEYAESVAEEITNAFADKCWDISLTDKVIDVLDDGEACAHQTDMPNVKAWEVIKLFHVVIERQRVDASQCCLDTSFTDTESSSSI